MRTRRSLDHCGMPPGPYHTTTSGRLLVDDQGVDSLTGEQPQKKMLEELTAGNDLGVRFVIPQQGDRWHFK